MSKETAEIAGLMGLPALSNITAAEHLHLYGTLTVDQMERAAAILDAAGALLDAAGDLKGVPQMLKDLQVRSALEAVDEFLPVLRTFEGAIGDETE